ncbi:hypothetical protein G4B88_024109 [Cannabis sativa]|uniref:Reverse transcriptase zinc-binding domain-containing protein n=1 Tax=Cannabis sativa TaxID=3483 RepID=A0A7J6EIN3_CANSA|nr:hypothetical protein G4B88_024109 [Cannabis sativa]
MQEISVCCQIYSIRSRSTTRGHVFFSSGTKPFSTDQMVPPSWLRSHSNSVRFHNLIRSTEKDRYLALTNWKTLCTPLENGGLNFKRFEDMNLALVSKLGWKLAKGEESLWTRVFCAKYWENGTNLFWNPESPKSLSYGARSILASRDLIRKESCFLLANGRTTNMWHAPWIPWLDWDQFRAAFNPMIAPTTTFVSSLLNEDREWDSQQTATWMVPSVASSLHLVPMLPINHADRLIWKDATNGEFSSRVAYRSIIKGRTGDKDPIWGKIWKLKISERMKLFLWKLGHDILPFGERLQRIFGNELVCAICDEQEDSAVHLFCHCPLAKSLWLASPWGIRSDELNLSSPLQLAKWLLEPIPLLQQGNIEVEEFMKFGVSLCFTLWTARNQAYHDHVQPSFFTIFNRIKSLVVELNSVLTIPQVMPTGNSNYNELQELLQNDFVVFVDAACKDLRSVAGIIVTKSAAEFVEAFSAQLQAVSPLEAEALALHHAVQRCITRGWHNVTFAVDCQPLVYGVKSRKTPDWRAAGVFAQLLDGLDRIPSASISWIPRSRNEMAHKLAKWSFNSYHFGFFNAEELAPLVAI